MKRSHLAAALLFSAFNLPPSSFGQGSLTPPGPPAPLFKTLDQVEPRTPVDATHTPGDAGSEFIISQPGSYYLTGNLGVAKTSGIQINAEGVTLDLNGFQISRASGSGGIGIEILDTSHRASVRNGSIQGFFYGINRVFSPDSARTCTFRDLAVSGCTDTGIFAGPSAVLESCRAHDNSGSSGIFASAGSSLTNCTAYNNTATVGIVSGGGSSLTNCTAYNNIAAYGISAGLGSSLTNCSASSNFSAASRSGGIETSSGCTITHCTAFFNFSTATATPTTGMGFDVGSGSTIQNCTANGNRGDGIRVPNLCFVRENTSTSNGSGGDAAGIHSTGARNRIEGNNVTNNDRGIDVDGAGSVIIKNTASANSTNYDIDPNNVFGAIVDRTAPASAFVIGNSAPSSAGTTDPWANISY
jgi:parallel beta-helix repeat protein